MLLILYYFALFLAFRLSACCCCLLCLSLLLVILQFLGFRCWAALPPLLGISKSLVVTSKDSYKTLHMARQLNTQQVRGTLPTGIGDLFLIPPINPTTFTLQILYSRFLLFWRWGWPRKLNNPSCCRLCLGLVDSHGFNSNFVPTRHQQELWGGKGVKFYY